MTCQELLESKNLAFLAFLKTWKRESRCPMPLADWLEEDWSMAIQSRNAKWAFLYPDRPQFDGNSPSYRGKMMGPCPAEYPEPNPHYDGFYWCVFSKENNTPMIFANEVRSVNIFVYSPIGNELSAEDFYFHCLVAFLDQFEPVDERSPDEKV